MNNKVITLGYHDGMAFCALENTAPTSMYIADVDKLVLIVTNRFLLASESMLVSYLLDTLRLQGMNEKDLAAEIHRMVKSNFLTAYRFSDSENDNFLTVYGLGYRGRGYLKSIGEAPRMTGYLAQLDAYSALKILAANQLLIHKRAAFHSFHVCKTILAQNKDIEKTHLIVRPQGMLQTAEGTQLLETVRRAPDYLEKLREKLSRMQLLLDREDLNMEVSAPSLTLICEDNAMLEEVRQLVSEKRYFFSISAVTDTQIENNADVQEMQLTAATEKSFLERLRNRLFYAA